jgi:CO/xanthine dehydrogenase Mo-binding subunit
MQKEMYLKSGKGKINLDSYAGSWVALVGDRPVACAESLDLLMQKVKKQRFAKTPSVMLVPRKDEGPYILIFQRGFLSQPL